MIPSDSFDSPLPENIVYLEFFQVVFCLADNIGMSLPAKICLVAIDDAELEDYPY
jgi:hypothetical protein